MRGGPDFLGIGAQRAGTTWLYENLHRHPGIRFPAGKEPHFWDAQRERGVDWYLSLFSRDEVGVRQGEITPAYAILDQATVCEIGGLFPDLRVLYILRNPIERAWSSALMALQRAEMTVEEASDQWFIDHFTSQGSLRRGDYEGCLRVWRSALPTKQILVLTYDSLCQDPRGFLKKCCVHIGVGEDFYDQVPENDLRRIVHKGVAAPIRSSLRTFLGHLYDHNIERLSDYLGEDLSHWRVDREPETLPRGSPKLGTANARLAIRKLLERTGKLIRM